MSVCVNMGSLCACKTAGMPQFTVYPELIGVWESERNAFYPKSQSMTLIFQLDTGLYSNRSQKQDLWVQDHDPVLTLFGK